MALHKVSDFDTDYQNTIQDKHIRGMSVYIQSADEKIGTVCDALVDSQGQFRYLIVDISLWIFGKKVLLPIDRGRIDSFADRVYVAMTKQQAEDLPEYQEGTMVDYDYEEQVHSVYRRISLEALALLDASALLATVASAQVFRYTAPIYDRDTYNYSQDSDLYNSHLL